jgi:hypothetical protein
MFWISWITEIIVWEQWHPTVKWYIEFITLIQVMHLKDPKNIQKIKDFIIKDKGENNSL